MLCRLLAPARDRNGKVAGCLPCLETCNPEGRFGLQD